MLQSIKNADITGKKIFVRCDLDVIDNSGNIKDTLRLNRCLPTLKYIISKSSFPVIAGHLAEKEFTTKTLRPFFNENLGAENFELMENLRKDPGEQENSLELAKSLVSGCDYYVNESFATCHREHASIVTIPKLLPAFAGFNLLDEIENLNKLLQSPQKLLVGIVGGAKIESKLPVINKLLDICDYVLVGGLLGLQWEGPKPDNLLIPLDYAENNLDIGPETIKRYVELIMLAKTVVWAGPMGQYENETYTKGTKVVAEAIVTSKAFSVVGGGDTTAALAKMGLLDKFSFVSTGGGAMLEYIAKGTLPGIQVLEKN